MAEFGKFYLSLEKVSTEVLGLLYSYMYWKFLAFLFTCLVQSNPVHPLHIQKRFLILWWANSFYLLHLLICEVSASAIIVFWIVPLEWPLFFFFCFGFARVTFVHWNIFPVFLIYRKGNSTFSFVVFAALWVVTLISRSQFFSFFLF